MTVKFKGFAVLGVRPVRVSVLDPPVVIDDGLKLHVGPELQVKLMAPRKVLGPEAEIVKVAEVEPMRTTLERALEESEKTGLPVPAKFSAVLFVAFEATLTLPVTLPVLAGVKLTATVQVWLTFKDAGTVGKLGPQLLVSVKPLVALMLVMVTG